MTNSTNLITAILVTLLFACNNGSSSSDKSVYSSNTESQSTIFTDSRGEEIVSGAIHLFFTSSITRVQANNFMNYLLNWRERNIYHFDKQKPSYFQLNKMNGVYQFKLMHEDNRDDPYAYYFYEKAAYEFSTKVFGGSAVEFHSADRNFNTMHICKIPECGIKNYGTLDLINQEAEPFKILINEKYEITLPSNHGHNLWKLSPGVYQIKYVQDKNYIFSPDEYSQSITIQTCENIQYALINRKIMPFVGNSSAYDK